MRSFLPAVLTLAIGMVLGAWQPRGELLTARAELRTLSERPCRRSAADRVRGLLTADRDPDEQDEDPPPKNAPDEKPSTAEPGEVPDPDAADDLAEAPEIEAEPPDPEEQRQLMEDALGARRSQARAALQEQAELSDEEMEEVDAVMDDMNRRLKVEIDNFVADALERGDLERRDMMEIAAVSLDVVIAADDRLQDVLPEGVEIDDEAKDPLSYIDAATIESLIRLEGFDDPESR